MQVHYTKVKQAMEIGCYISALDTGRFRIFWPQRSVELFASTVDEALDEMQAAQNILHHDPDYRIITNGSCRVVVINEIRRTQMVLEPEPVTVLWAAIEAGEDEWTPMNGGQEPKRPPDPSRINGIAKSGTTAYKEGTPASDCPYLEESNEFSRWNDEWDAAADRAEEERIKPEGIGSVVTNRYRAQYSELGHPTHCGDELATLLNNICSNKAGTNLEIFEAICSANGVSLAKYNRTSKGWQGRIRMTGRNLLAKRVLAQNGKLMMPDGFSPEYYQLTVSWIMAAITKYKPKRTT